MSAASISKSNGRSAKSPATPRARWRDQIRRASPVQQLAWLEQPAVVASFTAAERHVFAKQINRRIARARRVTCSSSWADAFVSAGFVPPGLEWSTSDRLRSVQDADGRQHAVRLVLSRAEVRNGISDGAPSDTPQASEGSRRWTPPQA